MSPAALEIKAIPPIKEAPKPPEADVNPMAILREEQQRMTDLARGISGGFTGLVKEASHTDLSQEKKLLGELQEELGKLNETTQRKIEDATGTSKIKEQPIPSWEEASNGEVGEEYRNAIRGETDGIMYHNGYTMREFVRKHPHEAEMMAKAYEKQLGKSHPDISLARTQVADLQNNPIQPFSEDPKYADLASSLSTDPDYRTIYDEIDRAHKMDVFGTTDFKSIPNDQFMELANSPKNLSFGSRERAKKAKSKFRKLHADKAQRYSAREQIRVYQDPDGVINPWKDPAIQALREPDNRYQVERWDLALQRFSRMYPDKAKAYASVIPELRTAAASVTENMTGTNVPRVDTVRATDNVQSGESGRQVQKAEENVRVVEHRSVTSGQEIQQALQKQIPVEMSQMNDNILDQRRQKLAERPILSSGALRDAAVGASEQPTFAWVRTDKIVGMAQIRSGGWSSEIEARKGRVVKVAREIIESGEHPENTEHIFHADKKSERIKVTAISGPNGPMYLVDDGTHRVSGAMVAGLTEIPCDVSEIRYPINQTTTDSGEALDWQNKIRLGLIDGSVEEYTSPNGVKMNRLTVKSETVPWIRTHSQADLIKVSLVYEKLYPGSLDKLKIPRDALVDPIANNFYMAGRWDEWVTQHSGKPRDENGVVKYY